MNSVLFGKKIINKNLFSYAILSVFFLLSNSVSFVFGYVAILYGLYKIIRNDTSDNIKLIFFLLPNIRILDVLGFLSCINIIVLLISFKYLITSWKKIKNIKRIFICSYLIFLLEFFHGFLNIEQFNSTLFGAINISFDFMVCLCIINDDWSKKDFREMSLSLSFGVVISALIFIICNPDTINLIFSSRYRLSAYGNDANYLSFYILIGISGLLIYSYGSKLNLIESIVIVLNIVIGLLTSSKMCILGMLIIFCFYLINVLFKGNLKKMCGIFAKIMPIIAIVLLFLKEQLKYLVEKFFERFKESYNSTSLDNFTSGRSELFSEYITLINNDVISLLFGRGINYFSYYQQYGMMLIAHNTYLDFILSWGVLGVLVFIILFIYNIRNKVIFKNNFINYLPLMIFMIMLMSLSCMSADMFWYILALVFIPLCKNKKVKGDD